MGSYGYFVEEKEPVIEFPKNRDIIRWLAEFGRTTATLVEMLNIGKLDGDI